MDKHFLGLQYTEHIHTHIRTSIIDVSDLAIVKK